MWTTLQNGTEYFKHVDEVVADRQAWEGKPLQLHGYVIPGSIAAAPEHAGLPLQGPEQPDSRRRAGQRDDRDVLGHRARHVQGRGRGRAARQAHRRGLSHRPERRDRQVPVEIRSGLRAPEMSSLGSFLLLAAFVVCSYAAVISVVGARRRSRRADRERHRRVLPDRRPDDRGLGGHDQRVPHRRLHDQVRRALLGGRAAAVLQDHVVLGRPRRLDHVLGVPAVDLRLVRGLHRTANATAS